MQNALSFWVRPTRLGMMLSASCLLVAASLQTTAEEKAADKSDSTSALTESMKGLDGKMVDLSKYKGKVVLIVNTASKCGLTPQYTELQAMYEKYRDQGLVVLGFPCNQFRQQEPGTAKEISEFCTKNYGVTFDMFDKVEVNGDDACPLYKQLTALELQPKGKGDIDWNFEKFVIDRSGQPVARFAPKTKPDDKAVVATIEKLLSNE
jgi:glutathione peroxidase